MLTYIYIYIYIYIYTYVENFKSVITKVKTTPHHI